MKKVSIGLVAMLAIVFAVMSSFKTQSLTEKWFKLNSPVAYGSFSSTIYQDPQNFDVNGITFSQARQTEVCGEALELDLVCALKVDDQNDDGLDQQDLLDEYPFAPSSGENVDIIFKEIQ